MTPFVSGTLGALAVLFAAAALRRACWMRRVRRFHGHSPPLRHLYRRPRTRPEQAQVISGEAEARPPRGHAAGAARPARRIIEGAVLDGLGERGLMRA